MKKTAPHSSTRMLYNVQTAHSFSPIALLCFLLVKVFCSGRHFWKTIIKKKKKQKRERERDQIGNVASPFGISKGDISNTVKYCSSHHTPVLKATD